MKMRKTSTMKRKKKRKTTTGSSRLLRAFVSALVISVLAVSAKDKKKNQQSEPQAVIAGTVFNSSGFALSGAEVLVQAEPKDAKEMKTTANDRGEFAVRVPA